MMKPLITPLICGALVGVSTAVGILFAADGRHEQARVSPAVSAPPVSSDSRWDEARQVTARTGDHFWGIQLKGVIPCSSMMVRGGGHIVILGRTARPQESCSFHVRDVKRVNFNQRTFQVSVTGEDVIRASALPAGAVAVD